MSEHTPTPWRVGANSFGTQFIYGNPNEPRTSPMGVKYNDLVAGGDHPGTLTEPNAAFIVKAVNSHDAMVKALEDLVSVFEYCSEDPADRGWAPVSDSIEDARRIIATVVGSVPEAGRG